MVIRLFKQYSDEAGRGNATMLKEFVEMKGKRQRLLQLSVVLKAFHVGDRGDLYGHTTKK